jgi:Cof subfamily protein (haloacid dehalogenase superfamily)
MTRRPGTVKISALLADVDGTLVTHEKVLTPRAQAAVRALRDGGIRFAITSGRPPRGMAMLVDPLQLDTPIAAFNGGIYVNPDLSAIEAHALPPNVARMAAEIIAAHGLDVWVYRGNDWLLRDPEAPHVAREQWTVKFPPQVVADVFDVLEGAVKIVGVSDDHERVKLCEAAAQGTLARLASAARSQPYYLDVTHLSANKGDVVEYLSRHLAIPRQEIATIGDMPNDVLMFHKSGLAIAMGNASREVQEAADVVTDSSDEDGFAKAVERFVLKPTRLLAS